jgi:predicted nuclease of predicted toxin-antitoxin system
VNVLLDECVPARLGRSLTGHSVTTVQRRGWTGFKNGDLLRLAEKEYGVFITVDRKISVQQDLTAFNIAVVLIRSRSNRLEDIRTLVPQLLETLNRVTPRSLTTVGTL